VITTFKNFGIQSKTNKQEWPQLSRTLGHNKGNKHEGFEVERPDIQTQCIESFSINISEKFSQIEMRESFRTTNIHDQKRTSPHHILFKTPRLQKKLKDFESCKRTRCVGEHL
jgi:hypothetical protein